MRAFSSSGVINSDTIQPPESQDRIPGPKVEVEETFEELESSCQRVAAFLCMKKMLFFLQ